MWEILSELTKLLTLTMRCENLKAGHREGREPKLEVKQRQEKKTTLSAQAYSSECQGPKQFVKRLTGFLNSVLWERCWSKAQGETSSIHFSHVPKTLALTCKLCTKVYQVCVCFHRL
jgi:hypothetical protein